MMKIQYITRDERVKAACWIRLPYMQRFLTVAQFMGMYSVIARYDESGQVYLLQYLKKVLAR
jgi:hypothetical protein